MKLAPLLFLAACGQYPAPPIAESPPLTVVADEREADCLRTMPATIDLRDGWSWRYACWWTRDDAGACLTCASRPCECDHYPTSLWAP